MKVISATSNTAPIIMIYGHEGRGKTTLASKSPKPLAFLLERGLPRGITIDAVEDTTSFDVVMAALRELHPDPQGYETLVFDTADALEPMVIDYTCRAHGWRNIETPSFGKGYVAADDAWRTFIRAITTLRDKHNIMIVMTCHAGIERFDDPRAPSFTAYAPRLHKRARGLLVDACDAVFFLDHDLRTVTDGNDRIRAEAGVGRVLFTEGRASFTAKNRWAMPAKMPLPPDFDFRELTKYWGKEQSGDGSSTPTIGISSNHQP
jgi:AAA domain